MAVLTAARRTAKDTNLMQDCECVRIVRTDGTVYRFTNAVSNLTMTTYNNAGTATSLAAPVTYQSDQGFVLSAVGMDENQAGSIDIEGIASSTGVTRNAILSGFFDKARVYIFQTDYTAPVEDDEAIFSGYFGEATIEDGRYVLKFSSLIDVLNINLGEKRTRLCRAKLGDERCGVNLNASEWQAATAYAATSITDAKIGDVVKPSTQNFYWFRCSTAGTSDATEPTWTTSLNATTSDNTVTWVAVRPHRLALTVASVAGTTVNITETVPAYLDDHYTNGYITVGSGPGVGERRRIVSGSGSTFVVDRAFLTTPTVGNSLTFVAGCTKLLAADCNSRFLNTYNYQGDPYKPGALNVKVVGGTK